MVQVLCYTGRGFDTCWRPASIATNVAAMVTGYDSLPYSAVRFFTGDFV